MNYGENKTPEDKAKITSFTGLNAWKEGHKLVLMIYRETKSFPKEEMFGITSQIRRSVVSITSNLAEGFSRNSYKDKLQFYSISQGSVTEAQDQLLICRDIGYMSPELFQACYDQSVIVNKLVNGLLKKTKTIIRDS